MSTSGSVVLSRGEIIARRFVLANVTILLFVIGVVLVSNVLWLLVPATILVPILLLAGMYVSRRLLASAGNKPRPSVAFLTGPSTQTARVQSSLGDGSLVDRRASRGSTIQVAPCNPPPLCQKQHSLPTSLRLFDGGQLGAERPRRHGSLRSSSAGSGGCLSPSFSIALNVTSPPPTVDGVLYDNLMASFAAQGVQPQSPPPQPLDEAEERMSNAEQPHGSDGVNPSA